MNLSKFCSFLCPSEHICRLRYAYTLVLHKRGRKLYEGTYFCVEAQLQSVAASIREQTDPTEFIELLIKSWNDHTVNMRLASDVLMYLEKSV